MAEDTSISFKMIGDGALRQQNRALKSSFDELYMSQEKVSGTSMVDPATAGLIATEGLQLVKQVGGMKAAIAVAVGAAAIGAARIISKDFYDFTNKFVTDLGTGLNNIVKVFKNVGDVFSTYYEKILVFFKRGDLGGTFFDPEEAKTKLTPFDQKLFIDNAVRNLEVMGKGVFADRTRKEIESVFTQMEEERIGKLGGRPSVDFLGIGVSNFRNVVEANNQEIQEIKNQIKVQKSKGFLTRDFTGTLLPQLENKIIVLERENESFRNNSNTILNLMEEMTRLMEYGSRK